MPIERVVTGIPGLDDILHGGIPKRNVVLLSGCLLYTSDAADE